MLQIYISIKIALKFYFQKSVKHSIKVITYAMNLWGLKYIWLLNDLFHIVTLE